MAQVELEQVDGDETPPGPALEQAAYDVLRGRLRRSGDELRRRLDELNAARKEVFGGVDVELIATERVSTDHNCVPRDMVAVGDRLLFGYNVHFGLKTERTPSDVFAIYARGEGGFAPDDLALISDERFVRDFAEIYRYYKDAVFAKFALRGPYLYMVFRVGRDITDVKAFKWAVQGDELVYVDNRSEHEIRYPPQHDFEWRRTTRDMHRSGRHPHISIEDRLFVETVGGDLTIKVENNTESGEGIYAEPVDHADQTLDDAEIYYAVVGSLILLKIKPYQESTFRYIVYNEKLEAARRLDAIGDACILLPDDQGLIFADGCYLASGECKVFQSGLRNMLFEQRIASPNGEDVLFVFYQRAGGVYVLLRYNVIEQRIETPTICHGFLLFRDGRLVCFRGQDEPSKHHAIQIWRTPFTAEEIPPPLQHADSLLFKIGNRDLVRGMAECRDVLRMIDREEPYAALYVDLLREAGEVVDAYFWLDRPEAFSLREPLLHIKEAAAATVDEFEKVVRLQKEAERQTALVRGKCDELEHAIGVARFETIDDYVALLTRARTLRGEVITARDVRYVDAAAIDALEKRVIAAADKLSQGCVDFLLQDHALDPYRARVSEVREAVPTIGTAVEGRTRSEAIDVAAADLEMLIDIVGNLQIEDAVQRTRIVDEIGEVFTEINRVRAALKARIRELAGTEGAAEFQSQLKLLAQGVANYLDVCDSPAKCDDYLTKLMVQVEELEGRFAEFDEYVEKLAERREEIYNAFEARKVALIERRNKRAESLASAADRILTGAQGRVASMTDVGAIHAYFASDLMIEKVRNICEQLTELDDSVRVDEIQSRLKTIKEEAVRQLKDRQELFVDGANVIRFGEFRFSVNTQPLDLTTVVRQGELNLHLTGTNYFHPIVDAAVVESRDLWDQEVVSENRAVYRGEYLASLLLEKIDAEGRTGAVLEMPDEQLIERIRQFMAERYDEGYLKGVHDHDAAAILRSLLQLRQGLGLLRFPPAVRACASVYWHGFASESRRKLVAARLRAFRPLRELFPAVRFERDLMREMAVELQGFFAESGLFSPEFIEPAIEYLFEQCVENEKFVVSRQAGGLHEAFHAFLLEQRSVEKFRTAASSLSQDPAGRFRLLRRWCRTFFEARVEDAAAEAYVDELAAVQFAGPFHAERVVEATSRVSVGSLAGDHPRISSGEMLLDFHDFTQRVGGYRRDTTPRFTRLVQRKRELVEAAREEMRLGEFKPRVLSSFVRNQLIDQVYLPLVGANLAKQIGVVGEGKRTDLMGMLLLISPPGYGKTTLMEYIASRLGLTFVKINGPAIGRHVTSLDPAEAPNAAAREEVEWLNLALEMGDNVMIYVDDIQHCDSEFLQKFISLCDAQRKIEGVYRGRTRTYDLRGRKVAVVMAGNPYTESGGKFEIPDMLANRADVYNLGEIIGDTAEAFERSYLENSLTSNPVLNPLAARSRKDVMEFFRLAERDDEQPLDLEGEYSADQISDFVSVLRKLIRVRKVVLAVNREYIRSAAQSADYRTEPAFKLQGSYRNMNRIAERVSPVMNDDELQTLILSNYESDAQTLTGDAEANLLKLRELMGLLTKEEAARWESIKETFRKNLKLRSTGDDDQFGRLLVQMADFSSGLDGIRKVVAETSALWKQSANPAASQQMLARLDAVQAALQGVTSAVQTAAEAKTTEGKSAAASGEVAGVGPLIEELRNLATALSEGRKITVVNKLPHAVAGIIREQFETMQAVIGPLLASVGADRSEQERLRTAVQECLDSYQALSQRLDEDAGGEE